MLQEAHVDWFWDISVGTIPLSSWFSSIKYSILLLNHPFWLVATFFWQPKLLFLGFFLLLLAKSAEFGAQPIHPLEPPPARSHVSAAQHWPQTRIVSVAISFLQKFLNDIMSLIGYGFPTSIPESLLKPLQNRYVSSPRPQT